MRQLSQDSLKSINPFIQDILQKKYPEKEMSNYFVRVSITRTT